MPFSIDLANNYPIVLAFLVLALLFLAWKWWNERDATDVGLKIQEKVREMLGEFKCTINGEQVSCKRGFASLGKNFTIKDAVDMVVRTMTSRLSIVDPIGPGSVSPGYRPLPPGMPPQMPPPGPGVPLGGGQMGPGQGMGMGGHPTEGMTMPPSASAMASSESVSPALGGVGGFGGLEGAGGFGGSAGIMGSNGGSLAGASQQQSMHMGSGGLINPGTSGAPPSLPPELQPIETSVRNDGGMGASMGGMGGMGGGISYDPDGF